MRLTPKALLSLFALATCANAADTKAPANVIVHDPAMAQEGKQFYVYTTGPDLPFYSSSDLKTWHKGGEIFTEAPQITAQTAPEYTGFPWAPDVHFHKGKYYLYFAVSSFGKNTSGIGVAVNKTLNPQSPDYHWDQQGVVLQSIPNRDDWNAIDPNVIEDEKGVLWMTFGSFWSGIKLLKLNADGTRPAEPQEWYNLAARERIPNHPLINGAVEAPFLFKKGDYYYLFVSFDLCCKAEKSTYNIRVGRSKTLTGPYLDKDGKDMMQGGGSLVLAGNNHYQALGHNSAYTFNGKDYLVFHAYDTADKYEPKLKILGMQWIDGWPSVKAAELDTYNSRLK